MADGQTAAETGNGRCTRVRLVDNTDALERRTCPQPYHDARKDKIKIDLGLRTNVEPERTHLKEQSNREPVRQSRFSEKPVRPDKYSPDWEGTTSPERHVDREPGTRRRSRDLKEQKDTGVKVRPDAGDFARRKQQEKEQDKDYKLNEFGDIDYRQTTGVFASVGNNKTLGSDGQIPGLGLTKEDYVPSGRLSKDEQYVRDFDFMIGKDRNKGLPEGVIPGLESSEPRQEDPTGPTGGGGATQPSGGIPGLDSPENDYRLPALPAAHKRLPSPKDVDPWDEQSRRPTKDITRTPPRDGSTRRSPKHIRSTRSPPIDERSRGPPKQTTRSPLRRMEMTSPKGEPIEDNSRNRKSRSPRRVDPPLRSRSPEQVQPIREKPSEVRPPEVRSVEVKTPREGRVIRIGTIQGTGTSLQRRKSRSRSPVKQPEDAASRETKLPPNMSMLPHAVRLKLLSDAKKQPEAPTKTTPPQKTGRSRSSSSSSSSGSSDSDSSSSDSDSSDSGRNRKQRHIGSTAEEETRRIIRATPKYQKEMEETAKRFIKIGAKRDNKRESSSESSSESESPPKSESRRGRGRDRIVISYSKKSKRRHDIHESPPASPTMSPPRSTALSPPASPPPEETKRIIITPRVEVHDVQVASGENPGGNPGGASSSEPTPKVSIEQVSTLLLHLKNLFLNM